MTSSFRLDLLEEFDDDDDDDEDDDDDDDEETVRELRASKTLTIQSKTLPKLMRCVDLNSLNAQRVLHHIVGDPDSSVKELEIKCEYEDVFLFSEFGPEESPIYAIAAVLAKFLETNTTLERLVISSIMIPSSIEAVLRSVERNVSLKEVAFNEFYDRNHTEETKKILYRLMLNRPSLKISIGGDVTVPANWFGPGGGFSSEEWRERVDRVNLLWRESFGLPKEVMRTIMEMTMGTDTIRCFRYDDIDLSGIKFDNDIEVIPWEPWEPVTRVLHHGPSFDAHQHEENRQAVVEELAQRARSMNLHSYELAHSGVRFNTDFDGDEMHIY